MLKNKLDKFIKKAIEKNIEENGAYDYDVVEAVEVGCENFLESLPNNEKFFDKVNGWVIDWLDAFKKHTLQISDNIYYDDGTYEYFRYAENYVAQWCFED